MSTNTHGLSRREHLVVKIEANERLNAEESIWARELLSRDELETARLYVNEVGKMGHSENLLVLPRPEQEQKP